MQINLKFGELKGVVETRGGELVSFMDKNGIYGYTEFEEGKRRKQRNEKQCFKTCAGIFINDGNAYRCDGMRKSGKTGVGDRRRKCRRNGHPREK